MLYHIPIVIANPVSLLDLKSKAVREKSNLNLGYAPYTHCKTFHLAVQCQYVKDGSHCTHRFARP